jgi:hypothetical protein
MTKPMKGGYGKIVVRINESEMRRDDQRDAKRKRWSEKSNEWETLQRRRTFFLFFFFCCLFRARTERLKAQWTSLWSFLLWRISIPCLHLLNSNPTIRPPHLMEPAVARIVRASRTTCQGDEAPRPTSTPPNRPIMSTFPKKTA